MGRRQPAAHPILGATVGAIVAILASTACASTQPRASSGTTSGGAHSTASTGTATPATATTASIAVSTGPKGAHLTDATGRTLYLFVADRSTDSTCYNACATVWPPLITRGPPQVTGLAKSNLVGTAIRTDGSTQVTYAGHPLYYFKSDSTAGDTSGQGKNTSGGLWWIVGPDGKAITAIPSLSGYKG